MATQKDAATESTSEHTVGSLWGVLSYPIYGIDDELPKKETTARQSGIEKIDPQGHLQYQAASLQAGCSNGSDIQT